ncbi:MAG: hypothetical protein Q9217_002425 [Psora testacea]
MTQLPISLDDPENIGLFLSTMRSRSTSSQSAPQGPAAQAEGGRVQNPGSSAEPINGSHGNDDAPRMPVHGSPQKASFTSSEFKPRPSPCRQGLMPPHNTPQTGAISPLLLAKDDENLIQNPTAVGEALYDYVQSFNGVPLSESMWAPKNTPHRQSLLKGPRAAPRDLTPVKAVEPNPAINDIFTGMSFKVAHASTQTPWPTAVGGPAAGSSVIGSASSEKPFCSVAPIEVSNDVPTGSQRSAGVLEQNEQEKRERAGELTAREKLGKQDNKRMEWLGSERLPYTKPAKHDDDTNRILLTTATSVPAVTESTAIAGDVKQESHLPKYVPPHLRHKVRTPLSVDVPNEDRKRWPSVQHRSGSLPPNDTRLPSTLASPETKDNPLSSDLLSKRGPKIQATGAKEGMAPKDGSTGESREKKANKLFTTPHRTPMAKFSEDVPLLEPASVGTSASTEPINVASTYNLPEVKVEVENREKQTTFTSWGAPELRDRPVFGGPLEQIYIRDSDTASVKFLHAEDCTSFYEKTSNGLVYGKDANGREKIVWVSLGKDVDVVGGLLDQWITSDFTRCVRAVPVDEDYGKEALWKIASRKNRSIEGIEDGKTPGGSRYIIFRFTDIAHAVQFRGALARDEEWEHCNITYTEDPCSKGTSPSITQ